MAVILQNDPLLLPYILTIIGLIVAFVSGSATNIIKDCFERKRMRKALYSEITLMHDALRNAVKRLANLDESTTEYTKAYDELSTAYQLLQNELRADTYRYVKALPALSQGIKDIKSIDKIYYAFDFYPLHLDLWDINKRSFKKDLWNQVASLRKLCEDMVTVLENLFKAGMLDKKLLLEESDSAPTSREYWKKLLEELPVKEKEPLAEEPKHKKRVLGRLRLR